MILTTKYKSYPKCKPSGVEWLGKIPVHWDVRRLKLAVQHVYEKVDGNTSNLPYIGLENIESSTGRMIEAETEKESDSVNSVFRSGNVLFGKLRPYLSKVLRTDFDGQCTGELLVLRPRILKRDFLFYFCISDHFIKLVDSSTYGAKMPRANWDFIGNILAPIPDGNVQIAITSFLDRETARIDSVIAKKKRLIELLREKRTSLITRAVTKGLVPNVPMKDSGVEWLGEIPAHWEVKKLKYVARLRSGAAITSSDIGYLGDYPVYGGNGLRGYTSSYTHEGSFVLIGRQGALCGCINFAEGLFWASEHAVVAAPLGNNNIRWLGELLRSMNLKQHSQSAAQPGLAVESITELFIPVPPTIEQRLVADFLVHKTDQFDSVIQTTEHSIQKLQEYRSALISAAVTGKIDVREVVQ